jgi:hypothetical protein
LQEALHDRSVPVQEAALQSLRRLGIFDDDSERGPSEE